MNAISATRRTVRREWTAFGTLLIISVGMMGASGSQAAHDLQSAVHWAAAPVETVLNNAADTAGSYFSALTQIDRLRTQNELLTQQNQQLQEELNRMQAVSKLNDDWSQITAEAAGIQYQTTPVRVIVRDISDVRPRTLLINKGTKDGLTEGQVVIDAGGALIGRIQDAYATVSTVLLITDPNAVVIGKEAKSGATGTISGSISGQLQMRYVDVTPDVAATLKSKPVVTAGESLPCTNDISPYPPGLLIGTITTVTDDPNAVVQSATIAPAAHLTDATFLLVITDYQGGFGPTVIGCPGGSGAPHSSASPGTSRGPVGSPTPASTAKPTPLPPQPLPSQY